MADIDVQRRDAGADGAGGAAARPDEVTARGRGGRRNWILVGAAILAVAALAYFGWRWWEGRKYASTDDAQVGANVIPVLARVAGYVQRVTVDENDRVKEGQVLVTIDPSELQQRLTQAEAQLTAAQVAAGTGPGAGTAQAQAAAARASAQAAQSSIAQAQANADKARHDVERLRPLADQGIVSKQQFDAAQAAADAAEAQLATARHNAQAAQAQAQAAQAGVPTATSQVQAAEAAVAQARLQLQYTTIESPAAGVVARKNVEPGQLVNPGQALMSVVPVQDVWVTANLKETQMAGVRPGDPAEITVDSYPGLTFRGRVESISPATGAQFSLLPPENATGNFTKVVQRIPVRIRLNPTGNPDVVLRPGMSAEVSIRKAQ